MRTLNLNALTQGIQRLREKGSPDQQSLYDLVNGYVAIDGSVRQRPGTELVANLPAGTHGMIAHRGEQVVFATSPKSMPAGFRCEVVAHPNPEFSNANIKQVWFAAPFLGEIYAVVEFDDGAVEHFWLKGSASEESEWKPAHAYRPGDVVVPGNGLAYRARRLGETPLAWTAGEAHMVGDVRSSSIFNGFDYEVTEVGGSNPRSGATEPNWPNVDGGVVVEWADEAPPVAPPSGGGSNGGGGIDDRYCVCSGSMLDDGSLADDAMAGDMHMTWTPEDGWRVMPVVAVGQRILQPCVRITLEDGSVLRCSTTTPFTAVDAVCDGEGWPATHMLGHAAFNADRAAHKVVSVEPIGMQMVIPLDFGGRSFGAGDVGLVYSHNIRKGPNNNYNTEIQ